MAEIIPFVDPETELSNLGTSKKPAKQKGLAMGAGRVNKLGEPSRMAFGKKPGTNAANSNQPENKPPGPADDNHVAKVFGPKEDDLVKKFNAMGIENTYYTSTDPVSNLGLKLDQFHFALPHAMGDDLKEAERPGEDQEGSSAEDDDEDFPEIEHCHPDDTKSFACADVPVPVDYEGWNGENIRLQTSPEPPASPGPAIPPPGSPVFCPMQTFGLFADLGFEGIF